MSKPPKGNSDSEKTAASGTGSGLPKASPHVAGPESPSATGRMKQFAADQYAEKKEETHKLWKKFGGGFYGAGAVVTYAALTVRDFFESWRSADGWISFIRDNYILDFGLDAIGNTIEAALWLFLLIELMTE